MAVEKYYKISTLTKIHFVKWLIICGLIKWILPNFCLNLNRKP